MEFRGPGVFVRSCRDAQLWNSLLGQTKGAEFRWLPKRQPQPPRCLSWLLSCGLVLMESGSQPRHLSREGAVNLEARVIAAERHRQRKSQDGHVALPFHCRCRICFARRLKSGSQTSLSVPCRCRRRFVRHGVEGSVTRPPDNAGIKETDGRGSASR